MKIIKEGKKIGTSKQVQPISCRRYIMVCKKCECIFEVNSSEFKKDDRDIPQFYVNCPCCNHYAFKSNGKLIKEKSF